MDTMQKKSVLMFPWLGHGHISPFLELGKKLSQKNFTVYLCSTPVNLKKYIEKEEDSIQFVEFHLPILPNLPAHYHTTNGLPPLLMDTLKVAFNLSKPRFCQILKNLKPDLLIYDFLQPWAPDAAFVLNIPAVQFVTSSSTMTSVLFHTYKKPDVEFPFSKIFYRDYEAINDKELRKSVEDHKTKGTNLVIDCIEKSSKVVLIKGFKEIDDKYIKYLSVLSGKKVVPVGPLVQEHSTSVADQNLETVEWLDKKEKGSTVFVSFGSEYFLSSEDFEAIAQGLALSNVNFIWAVRFPLGEKVSVEDKLKPLGFYEKVGERGIVVEGWVPQAKILQHSSIGGFVSHCGWNSVIESMKFGVPLIAMPMHIDQPINARLVEEVGTGIEVVRSLDRKLQGEKVASVIKNVVVEESGEKVRKKARELSHEMKMKGDLEIDEVVKELEKLVGGVKVETGCRDLLNFVGSGPGSGLIKFVKQLKVSISK